MSGANTQNQKTDTSVRTLLAWSQRFRQTLRFHGQIVKQIGKADISVRSEQTVKELIENHKQRTA